MLIELIESAVEPTFVSVTIFTALFVPTVTDPKASDGELSFTTVPVPLKEML